MEEYFYCPDCGHQQLPVVPYNKPVADQHCEAYREEYKLISKFSPITNRIVDGTKPFDLLLEQIIEKS